MVTVAAAPVESPVALVNFRVKFSPPSKIASSVILTVNVFAAESVVPQLKFCDTAAKSEPPNAEPFSDTTVTVAAAVASPVRFTVIVRLEAFSAIEYEPEEKERVPAEANGAQAIEADTNMQTAMCKMTDIAKFSVFRRIFIIYGIILGAR